MRHNGIRILSHGVAKYFSKHRSVESYINLFNKSDEIDGFTNCDLFESGSEEVDNPIAVTQNHILTALNDDDMEITSGYMNSIVLKHRQILNTRQIPLCRNIEMSY